MVKLSKISMETGNQEVTIVHPMIGHNKQRGMTLIQALFVLVLGGIALSVALNQYQSGERTSRIQKNTGDIMEIIGAAKSNYGQFSYNNLTTSIAIGAGVIPKRLAISDSAAQNDFDGTITLVSGLNATADLTYGSVPKEVCAQIVTSTANGARKISVNGTEVKALDADVDIEALSTNCNTQPTATVIWTIGRT